METSLAPVVSEKLSQFRARRSRLIWSRAVSLALVTFIAGIAIVAVIDWYWLLSDQLRWGLSLAVYLLTGLSIAIAAFSRLRRISGEEEIARQVEAASPSLRENLLAAVELATDDPSAINDSPLFRRLLQSDVARQMAEVRIAKLLPLRLIGRSLATVSVVVLVGCCLITVGGERVRQLATRAVLPGANIARVSRVHVEILEPTPKSLTVAANDTVAIVAEVTGENVDDVTLETFSLAGDATQLSMYARTDQEFAAAFEVGDTDIEYRILAGDAVTERFRISAKPRPHVTSFHKRITYPAYSELQATELIEANGDIVALQGSTAFLTLDVDQPIAEAELRIDSFEDEEQRTIPLRKTQSDTGGEQWTATVPVENAGIYKVHLVAQATGFENTFSPKYEIDAVADLIPRVGFVDLEETSLLLPPNDILELQGLAEDDLPLAKLEQQVSVNGRAWSTVALDMNPVDGDANRVMSTWQWDLLAQELKPGDEVSTKLVATDRKGNLGESIPLRVTIASADFDPQRHEILEYKLALSDAIRNFSTELTAERDDLFAALDRLLSSDASTEERALGVEYLQETSLRANDHAEELFQLIDATLRQMPSGADASDVEAVGRLLAKVQKQRLAEFRIALAGYVQRSTATDSSEPMSREVFDTLKEALSATIDEAERSADHFQILVAHNFAEALAVDLAALLRQQEFAVNSPTQTWDRLRRQEAVVISQFRALERLIRKCRSRIPSNYAKPLDDYLRWIDEDRTRLLDASESEDKLAELQDFSKQLVRHLKDRQHAYTIDGSLPGKVTQARKDLIDRSGRLYQPIERFANAVKQLDEAITRTTQAANSNEAVVAEQALTNARIEYAKRSGTAINRLRIQRSLTQARADADPQFAADLGLTIRAATYVGRVSDNSDSLTVLAANQSPESALREISAAYRVVESVHNCESAARTLANLAKLEMWNSQTTLARSDHPRQWDLWHDSVEYAARSLRDADVPHDLANRIDALRWSQHAHEARRKITERRWRREGSVTAVIELETIRADSNALNELLAPIAADARAVIAKYAPSVSQLARTAAEDVRQLEEQTLALADAHDRSSETMHDLEREQENVNQQLADLFEALVDDANSQDLLDSDQRERARDADASIAHVREPAELMNRALETAVESAEAESPTEQVSAELAQSAERQEQTAQALEQVANHFERLETGQEIADSREALRQSERDLGIAREMEQQYNAASELANLSERPLEQLIDQLETELARNPEMQKQLSEISKTTLEEAQNSLELAAQDESRIQEDNERSDAAFQQRKQDLAKSLQSLAENAATLERTVAATAESSAASGRDEAAAEALRTTRERLREAAEAARNARESQPLTELAKAAAETQQSLSEASQLLESAKANTSESRNEQIHKSDREQDSARKDAEKQLSQLRDRQNREAQNAVKRANDTAKQADRLVASAERELRSAERRVAEAKKNLARKPEDQGRQRHVESEQARAEEQQRKLAAAKENRHAAQEAAAEVQHQAKQIANSPKPKLDANNPAAQLADNLVAEAQQAANDLNAIAKKLSEGAQFADELNTTDQQLARAATKQAEITADVDQTAQNVARAARHEARLQNQPAATQLQQASEEIESVAANESTEASETLASAASPDASKNSSSSNNAGQSDPVTAQEAVRQAEQAIADQADQIGQMSDALAAAAEASANSASDTSANSSATPTPQQVSASNRPSEANDQTNQPATAAASRPETTSPQSSASSQAPSQPSGSEAGSLPASSPFGPDASPQQLAQALDQLDRMQAAAQASQDSAGQQSPATASQAMQSLAQDSAHQAQSAMAQQRSLAAAEASTRLGIGSTPAEQFANADGSTPEFDILPVDRSGSDWGKLRSQSAEDVTVGAGEVVADDYRTSVEAYFRVLAERARKSNKK